MSLPPDDPTAPNFSYETSTSLYLFTSLTAGSSHIITATSRLETILKANRIPFKAVDTATDEKARRIWGRRAQGKKLPGLVREGMVLADLEQVEEWNEYGELKQELGTGITATAKPVPVFQSGHKMELPIRENRPGVTPVAAETVTSTQTQQQSLQQSLASEAAAAAKQRKQGTIAPLVDSSKIKPIPADAKAELGLSTASATSANLTSKESKPPTSPPIKREENNISTLDDPSTHNTSSSAALPVLSSHRSPSSSPPTTSILAASPEKDKESAPFASAGPASKAGLHAVTNNPSAFVNHDAPKSNIPTAQSKGDNIAEEASLEGNKANAGQDIVPGDSREDKNGESEDEDEDEDDEDEEEDAKGQLHVKFQEDRLKGAADDGDAAVESVGD